jgi:TonB family protein
MPRLHLARLVAQALALMAFGAAACATHRVETTVAFDEAPQPLWGPPLAYPESLMQARVEGSVTLQALVDTNGRIDRTSVRVLRSTNPGFEAPAVDMLLGTRFRPAYREGSPTVALIEIPVRFNLETSVDDSAAASEAVAKGERLARAGTLGSAMAAFTEARRLDTRLASSPAIWWALCWYGSVWGYAQDFLSTCDQLVALDPDSVRARDARGIARALTGEFQGAIADFEAVVAASTNAQQRAERAEWIQALRAGRNPLTPEVLERLRSREP